MFKIWLIKNEEFLVNLNPSTGEVVKSCSLDSVNGQTSPMEHMTDENNTQLNVGVKRNTLVEKDLTAKDCEKWGI